MTAPLLWRLLLGWAALVAICSAVVHGVTTIEPVPMPDADAQRWALDALDAARLGRPAPEAPASARDYRAAGPIIVGVWSGGLQVGRHVGEGTLAEAVRGAAQRFRADDAVLASSGWAAPAGHSAAARFTVTAVLGEGPLAVGVPYLESLGVVPLHEGLHVELEGRHAWATSEELRAAGGYDGGERTPLPDLTFGVDVGRLVDRLAREMGVETSEVWDRGKITRLRAGAILPDAYPARVEVTEDALRHAAVEGARFLLRHQRADGTYTYVYDARTGRSKPEAYNLPRHAGTTWFLAQLDNLQGMPEAREGARRALGWLATTRVRRCGGPELLCIEGHGRVELGSTALSALAAAEYLEGGDDPGVRQLLEGLTAFLRSMQREDGELMHEYDLRAQEPIDVQYLYYSGEAAFALLRAYEVLGHEEDLEVARRVMGHLTGAGWDFFGSRYYYGEEHWTCIAAAAAAAQRIELPGALDFCRRWAAFNREVQYREGETPWESAGAYGVGPLLLPRLTPVASRSEAFISTFEMSVLAGQEDPALRAQIEAGLGMLLRWRWDPGPTHLFADPAGARGGIPGSPVELIVRNDYVQHACSAMIRWAEILRRERESRAASAQRE